MDFKSNLKDIRASRGLTQKMLADLLNVSDRTVSSWEAGRTEPNMGMVEQMCKALNCKKSDLIGVGPVDYAITDEKGELIALIEQTDRNTAGEILRYTKYIMEYKKHLDNDKQ